MKDDPWAGLVAPGVESRLSARRINDSRWDLFWARDWQDRRVLLLSVASESLPTRKLPKLKEVEVRQNSRGARREDPTVFRSTRSPRSGRLRKLVGHRCETPLRRKANARLLRSRYQEHGDGTNSSKGHDQEHSPKVNSWA